jgi:Family of unknown function (DUF5995)
MIRRISVVMALAVLATSWTMSPARADHNTAHTIEQMTAHYQDPALEPQNKPFALLYLRTTEAMHDANTAGEFSDPVFWDTVVIPTFANYYLDAYAAWKRGDTHDVDVAWRIAFRTEPERLNCTQMIWLGINAHVNNDLAFMIEQVGPRYTYADHKHVDDVLVRTGPVVYPEIQQVLCPGLFSETVRPTADLNIFAWRELAWENAQRLRAAPTPQAREEIADQIRQHAQDKAREIIRWYR